MFLKMSLIHVLEKKMQIFIFPSTTELLKSSCNKELNSITSIYGNNNNKKNRGHIWFKWNEEANREFVSLGMIVSMWFVYFWHTFF